MEKYVFICFYLVVALLSPLSSTAGGSVDLSFANGSKHSFQAVVCRTDQHQVDNLMVQASVSAQGTIESQPVVLFIDLSHPVGSPSNLFQDLQIWTTKISAEDLLSQNRNYLSRNLDADLHAWYQKEQVAIQEKFVVTNEMSTEEMIATTDKSSQALDDLHQQLLSKQTKMLRSFGQTQVSGNTITFESGPAGLEMFTRGEPVDFADLLGKKFTAKVTCTP